MEAEVVVPEPAEAEAAAVEVPTEAAVPVEVVPVGEAVPEPETTGEAVEGIAVPEVVPGEELEFDDEEGDATQPAGGKKPVAKKVKKDTKKRELVFDEDLGQVVARRKRKPGRGGWGDTGEY